jgi:hypothetical protein
VNERRNPTPCADNVSSRFLFWAFPEGMTVQRNGLVNERNGLLTTVGRCHRSIILRPCGRASCTSNRKPRV